MQDRFKFRVWHIPTKTMEYNGLWTGYPNIGQKMSDCNFKIMQCTGLMDKNGKLIYEGDIIKIGNGSINGSVIETIKVVEWGINSWNVPSWITDIPDFSHYVIVIGNVYENPELLEDK